MYCPSLAAAIAELQSKNLSKLVYFIRDGAKNISTGCGPERLAGAEVALAEYVTARQTALRRKGRVQDPEDVLIDEVVAQSDISSALSRGGRLR